MLGFASSPRFVQHDTGPFHPERPDRIRAVYRSLRDAGLLSSPDPFPEFRLETGLTPLGLPPLLELEPMPADDRWLRSVHPQSHIDRVQKVCVHHGVLDQGDTPVEPRSFGTAHLAVGAVLACCDAIAAGKTKRGFAAVRPPGHHAEPDRAMGFCLFCNIAIGARYLQQEHGVGRIAIVDFDVHHGNGTQAAFESDPSVLFISLHEDPRTCYPGSGYSHETGVDAGEGFTLNLPMPPGVGDQEYLQALRNSVLPKLDEFRPELLMISAGFDAHAEDPLAHIQLSDDGFEMMTRLLVAAADRHCGGKIVSVLEGGYNLTALGRSVVRHLAAMNS